MTYLGEDKPSLEDLAHFGVKGMKWGVRREDPTNASYTTGQRKSDEETHGKGGVKRINRHLNAGLTREQAHEKEDSRRVKRRLAIAGAAYAAVIIAQNAPFIAQNMANNYVAKKTAAAGAQAAANIFSDIRGIASAPVISLAFDASTGVFR